jgi:hypothetical protein
MPNYSLCNPTIGGKFNSMCNKNSGLEAAETFWSDISNHVLHNVPQTFITLKDDNNHLYHYKINETLPDNGNKLSEFQIIELDLSLEPKHAEGLLKQSKKISKKLKKKTKKDKHKSHDQNGGKHRRRYKDESSSSSDSSDDEDDFIKHIKLKRKNDYITYWWYYPAIYQTEVIYTPTFYYPVSPYVQFYVPA